MEPTERELRMRCIEAAARFPQVHPDGPAEGVLTTATRWFDWVLSAKKDSTLSLPKKS